MEKIKNYKEKEFLVYQVKVSREEIEKQEKDFVKQLKENRRIKGFRKGKAPVALLKQIFSDEIQDRIKEYALTETYNYIRNVEKKEILT